jgi:hypothetical protein
MAPPPVAWDVPAILGRARSSDRLLAPPHSPLYCKSRMDRAGLRADRTKAAAIARAAVLACLAAAGTPASAELKVDPSSWVEPPEGIKLRADETVDLRTVSPRPIDPYAYRRGLFRALGLYEYKPLDAVPGQYTRPRYAFGLRSQSIRDALSLTGLDAESCVAPMVRMRARPTALTGSTGVSMTVMARCTFY